MSAVLFHLWGRFAVHAYGLCIAIGVFLFTVLMTHDATFKKRTYQDIFYDALLVGIGGALVGSRVLYILSEEESFTGIQEIIAFWDGGLSVLGGIVGALLSVGCFLRYKQKAVLPFLDIVALYAPLLQAVARFGCFFAGCCYGIPCEYRWAVRYTDPDTFAPFNVSLHPTQLYSAVLLSCIFLLLKAYTYKRTVSAGTVLTLSFVLVCAERFIVDFWRGDRRLVTQLLSYNQLCAFGLIGMAVGIRIWIYCTKER